MIIRIRELRPCPCCGSCRLDAGAQSATQQGVKCRSCGCGISFDFMNWGRMPSDCNDMDDVKSKAFNVAANRWNARADNGNVMVDASSGEACSV